MTITYDDWFDKTGNELTDGDGNFLSDLELEVEYEASVSDYEDRAYEEYKEMRHNDNYN